MIRNISLSITGLLLLQSVAFAQPQAPQGNPANTPAFSPYLNLLRPTGSIALNYFGIVEPQLQFQQNFNQLQQQNQQFGQQLNNMQSYQQQLQQQFLFPFTGHGATFNNTGHYFSSNPAMGGGGSGLGQSLGGFQAPINRSGLLGSGGNFGRSNFSSPMQNFGGRPMNNLGSNRNNNAFGIPR